MATGCSLVVHHTYYRQNLAAWEYPASDLEALCLGCHGALHEHPIEIYAADGESVIGWRFVDCETCDKCRGWGWMAWFKKYDDGWCRKCGGSGELIDTYTVYDEDIDNSAV